MKLETFRSPRQASELADDWCRRKMAETDATSLFLPSGNSVVGLYALWERRKPHYLEDATLVQVDDVADGRRRGMFLDFLHEHLPSYRDRIVPVSRSESPAELAILGFGTNGQVAFHEPGLPADLDKGLVSLSKETTERLGLAPGARGLTYGLGAFLETRAVLLVVAGAGKVESFRRFQAGDLELPAAHLQSHQDLTALVDEAILLAAAV